MKQVFVSFLLITVLCVSACSANTGLPELSEPMISKGLLEETATPQAPEKTDESINAVMPEVLEPSVLNESPVDETEDTDLLEGDNLYTVITDRIGALSDVHILYYSFVEGDERKIEISDSSLFIDTTKSIPVITAKDLPKKTSTGNPIWIEIDSDNTKMISISGVGKELLLGYHQDGEYIQTSVTCQVDAGTDVFQELRDVIINKSR